MAESDPRIADYGRRLFEQLGERAVGVAWDMIAHLEQIGDPTRAEDWRVIHAVVKTLRDAPGPDDHERRKPHQDSWLKALIAFEKIDQRATRV